MMKTAHLNFKSVLFLVLIALSCSYSMAQSRPQGASGRKDVLIRISNAQQLGAPVSASASLSVNQQTYGGGFVKVKNATNKPIVAIRGAWEVSTNDGGSLKHGWYLGGPSLVYKGGIVPGQEVELPVSSPPEPVANGQQVFNGIKLVILAVVYKDRTWWGEEGYAVYRKLLSEAQEIQALTEKLRAACQQLPATTMAQKILDEKSNEFFHSKMQRLTLRNALLDEQNNLRSDVVPKLDSIINSLKSFLN